MPDIDREIHSHQGDGRLARWTCLFQMVAHGVFSLQLRQILTFVTMAIGSMALAATLFAGEGALKLLWADLDRLMGNRVLVNADPGPSGKLLAQRPWVDFTLSDYECVRRALPVEDVRYVAPRFFGRAHVSHFDKGQFMAVDGITAVQEQDQGFTPFNGQPLSAKAHDGKVMECLITRYAAEILAIQPGDAATIRVDAHRFSVKGIISDPPESDRRFQCRVIVPYREAQMLWGYPDRMETLVVSWQRPDKMASTIEALKGALDRCRGTETYQLSSSDFRMRKRKNIVSNFVALGMAQALFCILVASIGVVNVMLSNVVRRSKEFAIRIAMGAPHKDIIYIVLAESAMIGVVGALAGILTAVVAAPPLCALISTKIPEASQLQPYFSLKGILIPLFVCGLSGLLAGIIPAIKVGQLDILKMLRSE